MIRHLKATARHGFSQPILGNSIRIALVVGTILNVINQGDRLFSGSGILLASLLLNYVVPFRVATFSASRHAMHQPSTRR